MFGILHPYFAGRMRTNYVILGRWLCEPKHMVSDPTTLDNGDVYLRSPSNSGAGLRGMGDESFNPRI